MRIKLSNGWARALKIIAHVKKMQVINIVGRPVKEGEQRMS